MEGGDNLGFFKRGRCKCISLLRVYTTHIKIGWQQASFQYKSCLAAIFGGKRKRRDEGICPWMGEENHVHLVLILGILEHFLIKGACISVKQTSIHYSHAPK